MLQRILLGAFLAPVFLLAGCSWTREIFKGDKVDYKTEATARSEAPTLEVPPDLTRPVVGNRYSIPGDGTSVKPPVTQSQFNAQREQVKATPAQTEVLPTFTGARIERGGSQRWLVVKGRPEQYWQVIKEFWQEGGFVINTERPEVGVMETDWAEKRSRVTGGEGALRSMLGKMMDTVSSTPERDKFRTRLEFSSAGETEIYISHRGMVEIYPNEARDQTIWQPRQPDPDLEAEFLRRLMVRLGSDDVQAKAVALAPGAAPERAKPVKEGQFTVLNIDDSFDRAWRRVGLALDRVGFTVEDRDRSKGVYYVRYADPDAASTKKTEGFFSRIGDWFNQNKTTPAERYQIKVSSADPMTKVSVLSNAGAQEETQTSRRILGLLQEQLR